MLTRLGRGVRNGTSEQVLAAGIDIAVDDAVELLLPDRVTPGGHQLTATLLL